MFIFDVTNDYASYPKKNQEQNFHDQTLTSFFQIYWPCDKRIKKYQGLQEAMEGGMI